MLFRFRAQQAADLGILDVNRTRRPKAISIEESLPNCERWRGQVVKEISRKVSRIQELSLSDYQIRDLNDELNRLFKEKWQWELRIRQLGGPNYMRGGGRVLDEDGVEIPGGGKGYRYFGRARELPGVKELFEAAKRPKQDDKIETRAELRSKANSSYYGYNLDEDDGSLLEYEKAREAAATLAMLNSAESNGDIDTDWEPLPGDAGKGDIWNLPTVQQVEAELLERRKRKLLDKL